MSTVPSSPPGTTDTTETPEPRNGLDRFFEITRRGSTIGAEVRGGLVTFVTMAYIVILNPIILSSGVDVDGNSLGFPQVAAVTALTAGVMTVLFGLVTRLPFAFAAGLGINSFLAVSGRRPGDLARGHGARRHQRPASSCCSPPPACGE